MPFIPLTGAAYTSRSLTAAAQRCLNLFPEQIPQAEGEPWQAVHYCTPGLTFAANTSQERCRGLYTAFDGTLFACFNQQLYRVNQDNTVQLLGKLGPASEPSDALPRDTPVVMSDNGQLLILVDGTVDGYFVDLTKKPAEQTVQKIDRNINQGWLGGIHISFQDTFFIVTKPDSAQFYTSLSNISADNLTSAETVFTATIVSPGAGYTINDTLTLTGTGGAQITVDGVDANGGIIAYGVTGGGAVTAEPANPVPVTNGTGGGATFALTYESNIGGFDPLDFAAMAATANKLVAAISVHRMLWVIGTLSYEVWVNTGGDGSTSSVAGTPIGTFPFSIFPDAYGNWGCIAPYSVVAIMNSIFWLSRDKFGNALIMQGEALSAKRISTHAIEFALSEYERIDDCVAMAYQQQGHIHIFFTFPSARAGKGATWVYDMAVGVFHERAFIDSNGIEYRHVANAIASAYDRVYCGDWRNGLLYQFDLDNYTDNGQAIRRVRSFPHGIDMDSNRRLVYQQLIAQMQVGSSPEGQATAASGTDFAAPDGTLLEDYRSLNSPLTFSKLSSVEGKIVDDRVVTVGDGLMLYQVSPPPSSPDYSVSFVMTPSDYTIMAPDQSYMAAIARADAANNGYRAMIRSDGSQYVLRLSIMPSIDHDVPLGMLTTGAFRVTLKVSHTTISVQVQRTSDGLYVNPSGQYGSVVNAVSLVDATYVQPGNVLISAIGGVPTARVPLSRSVRRQPSPSRLLTQAVSAVVSQGLDSVPPSVPSESPVAPMPLSPWEDAKLRYRRARSASAPSPTSRSTVRSSGRGSVNHPSRSIAPRA